MLLTRGAMVVALLGGLPGTPVHGQEGLTSAAAAARRAWAGHRMEVMVGGAATVRVQLPGSRSSAAMPPGQAVATLEAFLRGSVEVEVQVLSARETGGGRGYVELRRSFRERGTQELRTHRVLLGYRDGGGRWILAEVRVLD